MPAPRTLFDKIWDGHVVEAASDGTAQIGRASCRERV